jgi:hypothetical protein
MIFLHVYIIVHEYFGLHVETQKNAKMGFKNQLNMSFCMIISYTFDLHLEFKILKLINIKN